MSQLADQSLSPMTFEQLIGQSALTARLQTALDRGRIAHAVIFAAPAGAGKRTAAGLYARALLCQARSDKPCNHCSSCKKAISGNHADLHVIRPAEEGKSLGVEDARGIQRLIDVRPYEGGRVVVLVEGAHTLTPQAQNALLKTLEEPPEHAVLILLAETLSPLLPTILSRCAVYQLARLSADEVLAVLASHGYGRDAKTRHAAAMADGRPGKALALLADDAYWTLRDKSLAALKQLVAGQHLAEAMRFAQDNRARVDAVLAVWQSALRDALVRRAGSRAPLLSGEVPPWLAALELPALERMLVACTEADRALASNAIYSITMDNLFIAVSGGNA